MAGSLSMCTNPPSKEIKVKTCLSERIPLENFTMQIWTKTGRVDKMV